MKHCVYPGTFDPFTYGHLDIVTRALNIFDRVTVLVSLNPGKHPRSIPAIRMVDGIKETFKMMDLSDRVSVDILKVNQSVLDYMSNHREDLDNCMNIVRGIRNAEDAIYELNLYGQYRYFSHNIWYEFIPIIADPKYTYLSSSVAREAFRLYCIDEIADMVPPPILDVMSNP